MAVETRTRRERLRAETTREIKKTAFALLTEGGPDAVTLRAIARDIGMTAGAIYSYYDTRDALVSELISDVYNSLVDTLEAARDTANGPARRIIVWGEAFRRWAVENPAGFRLVYGDGVPGYEPPPDGPAVEAAVRACMDLVGLVASAWPWAEALQSADGYGWNGFDSALSSRVKAEFPDLPPSAVALAFRIWGRMHGLVALEVYGHLGARVRDPAALYRAELRDLVRSLGLADER